MKLHDQTRPHHAALLVSFIILALSAAASKGQTAWFIDGYHGGVHGHFPPGYTGFLVEQLRTNPEWRFSPEIEPDTWILHGFTNPKLTQHFRS